MKATKSSSQPPPNSRCTPPTLTPFTFSRIKAEIEAFSRTSQGKGLIKNIVLIDQAEVEIIKLNFAGIFVDISIKQASNIFKMLILFIDWRTLHLALHEPSIQVDWER